MSRKLRHFSADSDAEAAIDMSPLIDVVFILLIFFIVTTVFVEPVPGVDIDKPAKMASSKELDRQSIMIAVTQNGQVFYNNRNIGVNGVRSVIQSLQTSSGEKLPLIIIGDRHAQHGVMMQVVGAATEADVKSISFSTKK